MSLTWLPRASSSISKSLCYENSAPFQGRRAVFCVFSCIVPLSGQFYPIFPEKEGKSNLTEPDKESILCLRIEHTFYMAKMTQRGFLRSSQSPEYERGAFLRKGQEEAACRRHAAQSCLIGFQNKKNGNPCRDHRFSGGGGWIRTTEANATDLQSAPFGHSGTPPYEIVELVDGFEPPTC